LAHTGQQQYSFFPITVPRRNACLLHHSCIDSDVVTLCLLWLTWLLVLTTLNSFNLPGEEKFHIFEKFVTIRHFGLNAVDGARVASTSQVCASRILYFCTDLKKSMLSSAAVT